MYVENPPEEQVMAQWFENFYHCPLCDTKWRDEVVLHVQRQVPGLQRGDRAL